MSARYVAAWDTRWRDRFADASGKRSAARGPVTLTLSVGAIASGSLLEQGDEPLVANAVFVDEPADIGASVALDHCWYADALALDR
jgi:hypothetical protein